MPTFDEDFRLERKGEETKVTEKKSATAKKAVDAGVPPFVDAPADAPAVTPEAFAALQAEHNSLLRRVEALLAAGALSPTPVTETPVEDTVDTARPYQKHRTNTGGITYEQDGRLYNARMVLMSKQ